MRKRFLDIVNLLISILGNNNFDYIVKLICNTDTGKGIINCDPWVLYNQETDNVYQILKESNMLTKLSEELITYEYLKRFNIIY